MASGEQVDSAGVTRVGRLHSATLLPPVAKRTWWIVCGLVIQAAGVAVMLAWAYSRYKHDAVTGVALRTTVKLVWTETLHSRTGVAVLVGAALLFALGSVLLARPYVRSVPMLFITVPLAAVAGLLVLGALALVVAVFLFLANAGLDGGSGGARGRGSTTSYAAGKRKTKARDH